LAQAILHEAPNGFSRLTVREFLSFCGQARGLDRKSLGLAIDQACQRIDLGPALRRPLGELSKGWRQRAWLAQAILHEAPNGFSRLTVREFLSFCGQARGLDRKSLGLAIDQACQRIDLGPALRRPLGELSKGWRQRAWLAQAILHEPPVLVLDEPTDGLDPNQKEVVRRLVREISADRTIVLSTHILEEAEELCDHVVVMANGCLVADDPVSNLLDNSGRLGPAFARLTSNDGPVIQDHGQDSPS
jgi:ABC-type multidrug transport system ATPase subunit